MTNHSWQPPAIPKLAQHLAPALQARIDAKTKPPGSLGRLEEIALLLGLMQDSEEPVLRAPTVVVFAGDHGFAAEGVSPFPPEVTPQMVANFLAGGAGINVFARAAGLAVKVVDAGVAVELAPHADLLALKVRAGTRNALHEPALTAEEVTHCLVRGASVVAGLAATGCNAILPGEMGIGNSSAAALLTSALAPAPLADCVGIGAGHDPAGTRPQTGRADPRANPPRRGARPAGRAGRLRRLRNCHDGRRDRRSGLAPHAGGGGRTDRHLGRPGRCPACARGA